MVEMKTGTSIAPNATLFVITTDYGTDCDDQKAISQLIEGLGSDDELVVVVNGPQPEQAAKAIAQAYEAKRSGKFPTIALGKQVENNAISADKIFGLINDRPMIEQRVDGFQPVKLDDWHTVVDDKLKSRSFKKLEVDIIAPLFSEREFYDPTARLASDPELKRAFEAIDKHAIIQMPLGPKGFFGFNKNNSQKGLPETFYSMLAEQGYARTTGDGAIAKLPDFQLSATQPKHCGLEKSIATYMANRQVPWANMPGERGTTPDAHEMRVGMLTENGRGPYKMHAFGTVPAGFGIRRLAREVAGLDTEKQTEKYLGLANRLNQELDRFDHQVFQEVREKHPQIGSVAAMRTEMHTAVKYAADELKKEGMETSFEELVFKKSPITRDITAVAERQAHIKQPDGKSHLDSMTAILRSYNARSVPYDAGVIAAAHVVAADTRLDKYFRDHRGDYNLTPAKIEELKEQDSALYREFAAGVRNELTQDGAVLALSELYRDASDAKRRRLDEAGNRLNLSEARQFNGRSDDRRNERGVSI